MGMVGNLRRLLVALGATAAVLIAVTVSGAAPGTDASVSDFSQCANDKPPSSSTACPGGWINGILNSNNSHYAEDDVTPQRVLLTLPAGGPTTGRTVEISYLTRKSGHHAYDSLATWNHTQTTADQCQSLSPCPGGAASAFAIPLDPTVVADSGGSGSATSGHQLTGQVFAMYGGTITGASSYTHDDASGSSDEYAHITVTYSVPSTDTDTDVLLLFGGHLAASVGPRGWGPGLGAGDISGGPYHIRVTKVDGTSIGDRDNQIMAGAIIAPANLVIHKVAVGGDATFGYTATGGIASPFSITTSGGTGSQSFTSLNAGAYTVTESAPPAGWDFTSLQCVDEDNGTTVSGQTASIDLDPGETVSCTYTNTKRGNIIVDKVTNPSGNPQSFAFGLTGGPDAINQSFSLTDAAAPHNSGAVKPGTYSASETVPAGWDQTGASCSDGSSPSSIGLSAGETVTCTFTNTRQPAHLIVKKVVVNDNGGKATPDDFSFQVNGGQAQAFEADGQNDLTVDAGTYNVVEPAAAGYDTSYDNCSDINLSPGETATCTVTNNDQPAHLIVKKVVVNDNGGAATPDDFSFQVNGGQAQSFELDGQNDLTVDAGTYNVVEPAVAGYATSYDNCSGIVLGSGQTATCTVTNDDQPAHLIVKKVVVNDNGGKATPDDFSFQVNGGQAQAFEADGQNDLTVDAGNYNVNEPAVAGYTTTYDNCEDIDLGLGETATCTVTNNDVPSGKGSISVSKSADPTSLKEPGGAVTFSVRITNTSLDVDVVITNVVDDKFGDLDDDGGSGCFDVPITLHPGGFVSCQFTKQITGAGGTSHVDTVTASGHDENGNPVSGSDDARVDITPRLIDLVIVKDATSPTPLNGIVNYTMTVTNKGPDTATNVQLADPAPAGITYLTANPSQGTCNVSPALITCSLGSIAAGQTVTIHVTARATTVGSHTNTATVTGGGGRETNPGDNVDSAVTIVPAPIKPPTQKPAPKPAPCLALTVSPKMIKADGKPDRVLVKVTAGKKPVKGAKVLVKGSGVRKTGLTNGKGTAVIRINPRKAGLITISTLEKQQSCGTRRIGVVGVFLPPLTG